jgi:DNA-3-methyladenine glycosylase I
MTTYCKASIGHPFHGPYHDEEYGFPIRDDDRLFERLVLEINQAGLSWLTILKKRTAFREAFDGFDIARVARFTPAKRERLMKKEGIVRNRLKIEATVENAKRILAIQKVHGSFAEWLDLHHPQTKEEWVKLFRKTLVFTGGEITGEFLLSTGYLPGAHAKKCPVYARVVAARPPWIQRAPNNE